MSGIDSAIAGLIAGLAQAGGVTVTYQRPDCAPLAGLTAVPSEKQVEVLRADGSVETAQCRDWLVAAADLVIEGEAATPQAGDQIVETLGESTRTYEVMPIGQEDAWHWCGVGEQLLRVHTKRVGD